MDRFDLEGLTNTEIMKVLFREKIIQSKEPDFIYKNPSPIRSLDFSKTEGLLLGVAIGDALGNTSENLNPIWGINIRLYPV